MKTKKIISKEMKIIKKFPWDLVGYLIMFNFIIVNCVLCNFLSIKGSCWSLNWTTESIILVALMISHFNYLFFGLHLISSCHCSINSSLLRMNHSNRESRNWWRKQGLVSKVFLSWMGPSDPRTPTLSSQDWGATKESSSMTPYSTNSRPMKCKPF